jgi:hypothetical protein
MASNAILSMGSTEEFTRNRTDCAILKNFANFVHLGTELAPTYAVA